jgi:hypothetical protein
MIEAIAKTAHLAIQFILARVRKRRMADIVPEGEGFGEFFVEMQRRSHGAGDLGDFDGVGEPIPKMVRDAGRKDLGLIFKASKSPRMYDTVAITLELTTVSMPQFGVSPTAAGRHWKTKTA